MNTAIGDDAIIGIDNIRALYDEIKNEVKEALHVIPRKYGTALTDLANMIANGTSNGGISYRSFRKLRLFIEQMSDMTEGSNINSRTMAKRDYGAIARPYRDSGRDGSALLEQHEETIKLPVNSKRYMRIYVRDLC